MFPRHITRRLLDALSDSPVVLLHGARQTGKSTLVRGIASSERPARYLTFDDAAVLAAAKADPEGFLTGIGDPVALDEVQRAPELFVAIKAAVDRDRRPGRYLLTGSANVLMLAKLSESLAGRMEILTLQTLSQGEIGRTREGLIDALFDDEPISASADFAEQIDLVDRIVRGGYPEAYLREQPNRRRAWFNSYVSTILQRDVRDLANIEGLNVMPRLLSLLASRIGSLLNFAEISSSLGVPQTTLKRYMALLEAAFLVQFLPAWSDNLGKRLVKKPKLFLNDPALAATLAGQAEADRLRQSPLWGPLVENFVVMELRKQAAWSRVEPRLYHFRKANGQREVDVVMEAPSGDMVGIEVKAAATVGRDDFRGLRSLAEIAGRRLRRGVLLYGGRELLPFGERLLAMPLNALWRL